MSSTPPLTSETKFPPSIKAAYEKARKEAYEKERDPGNELSEEKKEYLRTFFTMIVNPNGRSGDVFVNRQHNINITSIENDANHDHKNS